MTFNSPSSTWRAPPSPTTVWWCARSRRRQRPRACPRPEPSASSARQYVLDTMGQSKIVVFRALFGSEELAQRANAAFESAYEGLIDDGHAEPIPGAAEAITRLRDAGVKVALTTGFSGTTQEKLLAALGWQSIADLVLAPGDGVRGRPYPDLILTALIRLQADGVSQRRRARRHQQRRRQRAAGRMCHRRRHSHRRARRAPTSRGRRHPRRAERRPSSPT